jgi:hypothetical protein
MRHTASATVEEALRWRAYLIAVVEDEGDEEVADREFGDSAAWISVSGAARKPD